MSLINPVIGMIENTKELSWHPVVFEEKPLPGPDASEKPRRFKSKMHHTGGFKTRNEAIQGIEALAGKLIEIGNTPTYLKNLAEPVSDYSWDGEGVPTLVEFFSESMLSDEIPA